MRLLPQLGVGMLTRLRTLLTSRYIDVRLFSPLLQQSGVSTALRPCYPTASVSRYLSPCVEVCPPSHPVPRPLRVPAQGSVTRVTAGHSPERRIIHVDREICLLDNIRDVVADNGPLLGVGDQSQQGIAYGAVFATESGVDVRCSSVQAKKRVAASLSRVVLRDRH